MHQEIYEAAASYAWEFGKFLFIFDQAEEKALECFARALKLRPCTRFRVEYAELLSDLERHADAAEILMVDGELPTQADELKALLPITYKLTQERPGDPFSSQLNREVSQKCIETIREVPDGRLSGSNDRLESGLDEVHWSS